MPSIEVEEDLIDLGLQENGAMKVPSDWDSAGWFTGGGRPGGAGPTVIAGHVDSLTGPAVFFRLTELRLITCTGDFDHASLTHADNRVVFAKPSDTRAG